VGTTATADAGLAAVRDKLEDLELRDRLSDAQGRAGELVVDVRDRAEDLRDRVPELLEELEPASRRARMKGWETLRAAIGVLLVLPRLLVRLLEALQPVAEQTAERGEHLAERARAAAADLPPVRRQRRRRRGQLALVWLGGVAVGTVIGWYLGQRRSPQVTYEATHGEIGVDGVPPLDATTPVAPAATERE
jgi:hypothetical protein